MAAEEKTIALVSESDQPPPNPAEVEDNVFLAQIQSMLHHIIAHPTHADQIIDLHPPVAAQNQAAAGNDSFLGQVQSILHHIITPPLSLHIMTHYSATTAQLTAMRQSIAKEKKEIERNIEFVDVMNHFLFPSFIACATALYIWLSSMAIVFIALAFCYLMLLLMFTLAVKMILTGRLADYSTRMSMANKQLLNTGVFISLFASILCMGTPIGAPLFMISVFLNAYQRCSEDKNLWQKIQGMIPTLFAITSAALLFIASMGVACAPALFTAALVTGVMGAVCSLIMIIAKKPLEKKYPHSVLFRSPASVLQTEGDHADVELPLLHHAT
ncbi:MAG: hypothetical protein A2298_03870 [Gammaproteobacteria bacterium RIFOXYB2_FULL_38_6]|nr:MAG: hypothetical protein A2298_03870 [Gammaproteobacteria bacterium RIFOXYB2_FULL_38_6]